MNQEKKNKTLVASLASLTLLAFLLFFYRNNRQEIDKTIFQVNDLSVIDRVELISASGNVELRFNGSKWLVNDNHEADEQLITVLFATLQQVEPKRQVAGNLRDSIAATLTKNGVQLKLYQGEALMKDFYVGGNAAKTEAYFLDDELGPFVMTIPGYRVYVAGVFEVEANGWRDRRVFNFNWRNFKKLEAVFSLQPDQNFVIADQGAGFDLVNSPPSDTTRLNDYLDAVSLLIAKEYLKSGQEKTYDSLIQTAPIATIRVYDLGDNALILDLYPPLEGDTDALGRLNGADPVLFTREQVIPILKARDYFKK